MPDLFKNHQNNSLFEDKEGLFIQFAVLGQVPNEADKIYYWPQMERLFELLDPLLGGFKFAKIFSDQAYFRAVLGPKPKQEVKRITGYAAPTGGRNNRWSRENMKKVATVHLSNNAALVAEFNGVQGMDHYPKDKIGLPMIFRNEFYGRREPYKAPSYMYEEQMPMDFYLMQDCRAHHYSGPKTINQHVHFYFRQGLLPPTEMNALALEIGKICLAKHIFSAVSGWRGAEYTDEEGSLRLRYCLYDERFVESKDGKNGFGNTWVDLLKTKNRFKK